MDGQLPPSESSPPLIAIRDLHKVYHGQGDDATKVHALQGIDLEIQAGEFVAIMGPSGSGKSTLMQILGLLDHKTSGKHYLDQVNVSNLNEDELAELRLEKIGFVFQFFNLLPRTAALDNVSLPLLYAGDENPHMRASELLKEVGLGDRLSHRPHQLSGGQQQRVAIARALANRPRLILADEPTGNISSHQAEEILNMFDELNRQGTTIILVTHEPEVAHRARRLITIKDGLVYEDQTLKEPRVRANLATSSAPPPTADAPSVSKISFKNQTSRLFENARMAVTSLSLNKLRTALATLGVIIGIASFMAMMAVGSGAQVAISAQLESLGTNLLNVRGTNPKNSKKGNTSDFKNFSYDDFEKIKLFTHSLREVRGVDAQVYGNVAVAYNSNSANPELMGATPEAETLMNLRPVYGRFFTADEEQNKARVVLLGPTVVTRLFGENAIPIGALIKINRVDYEVVGILPTKGSNSFKDRDDIVVVPLRTAMYRILGRRTVQTVTIASKGAKYVPLVQIKTEEFIRDLRRLSDDEENDFQVRNSNDIKELYDQTTRIITSMLQAIAAVSLLVGGIGIMNVMFVSVKERTREVGLRKALGGKKADIMSQFLVESVLIGILGGAFGVLLGAGLASLSTTYLGFPAIISWTAIAVSFSFSFIVGVVFGIWPAKQASQLSPIEALRYE